MTTLLRRRRLAKKLQQYFERKATFLFKKKKKKLPIARIGVADSVFFFSFMDRRLIYLAARMLFGYF